MALNQFYHCFLFSVNFQIVTVEEEREGFFILSSLLLLTSHRERDITVIRHVPVDDIT